MDIVFAYLAGLLTLINPCVLPVLPIVLASAAQGHRLGPVALALGMAGSFAVLGLAVTAFGPAIGLDADRMARIGAGLMVMFLVNISGAAGERYGIPYPVLARASDVVFQVHNVDPPPEKVQRSLELLATEVAPALGWGARRTAA